MVLIVCYHESPPYNRESIQAHGLLPGTPFWSQPHGVYAFTTDVWNLPQRGKGYCEWVPPLNADIWRIVYCGPMERDPLVSNAVVLPAIPHVTLVTGNDR